MLLCCSLPKEIHLKVPGKKHRILLLIPMGGFVVTAEPQTKKNTDSVKNAENSDPADEQKGRVAKCAKGPIEFVGATILSPVGGHNGRPYIRRM